MQIPRAKVLDQAWCTDCKDGLKTYIRPANEEFAPRLTSAIFWTILFVRNESVLECVSVSVFVRGGVSNLWRLGLSAHVGMAAPWAASVTKPKSSTPFPQLACAQGLLGEKFRICQKSIFLCVLLIRAKFTCGVNFISISKRTLFFLLNLFSWMIIRRSWIRILKLRRLPGSPSISGDGGWSADSNPGWRET